MLPQNDEELPTLQRDVQRLLGRCLLRLQQCELQIKALVSHQNLSGPIEDLERVRDAQIDDTARKTLGTLVGELLGSYLVVDGTDRAEEAKDVSSENVNWFAMQMTLGLSERELDRVKSELREMVRLRNDLVHHFVEQNDLGSVDGCRNAQRALVTAYNRIDQHFGQLRQFAESMEKSREAILEALHSEGFKDLVLNGFAPDGQIDWDASGVVSALGEAFGALAVDGWANLTEAGTWIAEQYPEQCPATYGCNNWRQVVHNAPRMELRYFEKDGQRTAFFRKKKSIATAR